MTRSGKEQAIFRLVRDVILFLSGLALLGWETFGTPEPRLAIIGVAAAMLGLPGTLITDRLFSGRTEESIEPSRDTRLPPPT